MGSLEGKVAVVTGAAQGIGLAIATRLVADGARVVLGDLDADGAEKAAGGLGAGASAVRCDVTSEQDMTALVGEAVTRYGALDVMVNNAGITRDATIRTMSLDDLRIVLDVHVAGTWIGCKVAGAAMRAGGSGAIVNISSIAGKVGNFGQTNYSAAKAGIVGLTKACAKEFAKDGVRVNAIQPGLIRTAMTEAMPEQAWNSKMAEIPLRRAGEPSEVAAVAAFLAGPMSSYMTGAVLEVTGGRYM
ncbi:3-oxoacyl-ACP reductase FabG [Cryptosporangium sp. NPDC051539]|uniref:3-oxoacyl-ACP reductase FabG n=1 Tax=Cryptosporangium sp. NPDC051539 TaxID=3363962 RepID=UPI00378D012E